MYEESESKYWYHDGHDRKLHEFTALSEKTVCSTISSVDCVNQRECVDGKVQKKEDDKEKAAYTHDKLLGD